jgi:hypothetical protein
LLLEEPEDKIRMDDDDTSSGSSGSVH